MYSALRAKNSQARQQSSNFPSSTPSNLPGTRINIQPQLGNAETVKPVSGQCLQKLIPARIVMIVLLFLWLNLDSAFKAIVAQSLVDMVDAQDQGSHSCPSPKTSEPDNDLSWTPIQQNLVLSSFFFGYLIAPLPASCLVPKMGARIMFLVFSFLVAVLSCLGPVCAQVHFVLFMIVRMGQGWCQGALQPALQSLITVWFPEAERNHVYLACFVATQLGLAWTLPLIVGLASSEVMGGWPLPYYILGILGLVWLILWALLTWDSPEVHPYMSQAEYDWIKAGNGGRDHYEDPVVPYDRILQSRPVQALLALQLAQMWIYSTVLLLVPTYTDTVLHMDLEQTKLVASMPYLGGACFAILVSFINETLRSKDVLSTVALRKINMLIAYIPTSICLALVPFSACNIGQASWRLSLAMTFNGAWQWTLGYEAQRDLVADQVASVQGLLDTVGALAGIFVPLFMPTSLSRNTIPGWSLIFFIASAVSTMVPIFYSLFGVSELQPWAKPKGGRGNASEMGKSST